jgi:hypothetical protein
MILKNYLKLRLVSSINYAQTNTPFWQVFTCQNGVFDKFTHDKNVVGGDDVNCFYNFHGQIGVIYAYRTLTVVFAVLQAVYTSPYIFLVAVFFYPHSSSVLCSAVATYKQVVEWKFSAILTVVLFLVVLFYTPSSCDFALHHIKHFRLDDCRMMFFDKILGNLPCIFLLFLDWIECEGLSCKKISLC